MCCSVAVFDLANSALVRRLLNVAAIVPAVVAAIWLRPAPFASPERAVLSTSQLIGLASAAGAAALYWVGARAAKANPAAAMSLELASTATHATSARDTTA
jgi:hypothetical protein